MLLHLGSFIAFRPSTPLSVSFSSTICLVFYQMVLRHIYGLLLHVAAGIVYLHFCARSLGLESCIKTLLNDL